MILATRGLAPLLALAPFAPIAAPAGAQLDLAFQGGALGGGLVYTLQGDATQAYFLLISLQTGPTPLAPLDPSDPRSLEVGLDLIQHAASGTLTAPGFTGSIHYGVPSNSGLVGTALHAQGFTFPGEIFTVDDISDRVSFAMAPPSGAHLALGDQLTARRAATATATGDGRVLVAGGRGPGGTALANFEWFLEDQQVFQVGGSLGPARSHHGAVLLDDGRVLLAGGLGDTGGLSSCALVDPATGAVAPAASMAAARAYHALVKLADGRVLAAGGSTSGTAVGALGLPESLQSGSDPQLSLIHI